jgi:hypothetical protein
MPDAHNVISSINEARSLHISANRHPGAWARVVAAGDFVLPPTHGHASTSRRTYDVVKLDR